MLSASLSNLNYGEILTIRKVAMYTRSHRTGNQEYSLYHYYYELLSLSLTATHFGKHFSACRTFKLHNGSLFCCSIILHNHLFLRVRVIQYPFASSLEIRNQSDWTKLPWHVWIDSTMWVSTVTQEIYSHHMSQILVCTRGSVSKSHSVRFTLTLVHTRIYTGISNK